MTGGQVRRLVASHGLAAIAMSMPWPALLAAVWAATGSELWLAVVGAARMAPYVVLSWAAGSLGDRLPRVRVVKVSTAVRLVLLTATLVLLGMDHLVAASAAATCVVAVGTPAYPSLAAGLPDWAGRRVAPATRWLVTLEVSAFVVGPAVGGVLLGLVGREGSVAGAVALAAAALLLTRGLHGRNQVAGQVPAHEVTRGQALRILLSVPSAVRAIVAVAVVNGVVGALGVGLLALAEQTWGSGERAFGLTTAALGFGALATPVLCRLLRLPSTAVPAALVLTAVPLLATALAPTWWWALLPLAMVGVGATQVECVVTALIQDAVPDHARAFALGVTDTAMVTVALAGAAAAPLIAAAVTPQGLLATLLLMTTGAALLARSGVRGDTDDSGRRPVGEERSRLGSAEASRDVGLGSLV